MKPILSLLFVATLGLSACAGSSPRRSLSQVESMVKERSSAEVRLASPAPAEKLSGPLTADMAARLALARNASFKGKLEEVGLAQAELSQAGILENPRVHASFRRSGDGAKGREVGATINLLDLFELPLRRRVASSRLEQAKFQLSHEVLSLTSEAKAAFYHYQAEAQKLELRRDAMDSLAAAVELAERQREAGNISRLDLASERAEYHEATVELAEAESATVKARERLAVLTGLQGEDGWTVEPELPELPESDPDPKAAEEAAVTQRWDLQAARRDPKVLKQSLAVERLRMFTSLNVGVDSEKEFDGETGYGPEIETGLPLFDRRQAAAARVKAEIRRSLASAEAFEQAVRLEARVTSAELAAARKAATAYRQSVVPLRREILQETLKQYNFMLTGVFQLLEAKRRELEASSAHVEAVANYWTKRAELERAVGGKLP